MFLINAYKMMFFSGPSSLLAYIYMYVYANCFISRSSSSSRSFHMHASTPCPLRSDPFCRTTTSTLLKVMAPFLSLLRLNFGGFEFFELGAWFIF